MRKIAAIGAGLVVSLLLATCATKTSVARYPANAAPAPTPVRTPRPTPTAMPVVTPSSPSIYDRAPGILYEENRPPPPTPAIPTPRPPRTATPAGRPAASAPSSGRPTPTRKPGAYYEEPGTPLRTPTPTPSPTPAPPAGG